MQISLPYRLRMVKAFQADQATQVQIKRIMQREPDQIIYYNL